MADDGPEVWVLTDERDGEQDEGASTCFGVFWSAADALATLREDVGYDTADADSGLYWWYADEDIHGRAFQYIAWDPDQQCAAWSITRERVCHYEPLFERPD